MSDIGGSLERFLAWANLSAARAVGFVVVPVLVFLFGIGTWSYFWSGYAIREAVGAGLPADAGVIWASLFVGLAVPGFVFTVFVMLFAATKRWWSLVLMVISFGPVIFSAAVNPAQVTGRTRVISRSIEQLTLITGDAHVAEVIFTAVRAGKFAVILIALGSIVWALLLGRRRRFPDASTRHRAVNDERSLERYERGIRIYQWGYPFFIVAAVPLIALAGAANAA